MRLREANSMRRPSGAVMGQATEAPVRGFWLKALGVVLLAGSVGLV
jgi:hypothetical protein